MSWQAQLNGDPLPWLLESADPAARHLALRDLLDRPADDPELRAARTAAHQSGPIAAILDAMAEEGCWVKPGPGYGPKYRSTVWSVIMLAQLGASAAEDPRIPRACAYLLDHALTPDGRFSTSGGIDGNIDCLHGNLCTALLDLGYDDPRLEAAYEWAARSVTGEGVAPKTARNAPLRFAKYNSGPGFMCRANSDLPCAWGAVKIMLAFSGWPSERRTPLIERAIQQSAEFLLATDPVAATYPTPEGVPPSQTWWQFGFPVFYSSDLLQNVDALVALGYGHDPRLHNALEYIRRKQDDQGRWLLEYRYYGDALWADVGRRGQPSKWITLRALRVLKAVA